ncbi:FAD:protein FMN transferase [Planotetraspora phitsanulokensis]|uniref:FAD:protein FMN transferase n=2 Tax=Planotetraspora phitsanulokensis TaxID=575192 RepID=A0A8J3XGH2_9ACTN|nr:FAD:protein FMN transferase [Planotetraspora phitsanulokensis]
MGTVFSFDVRDGGFEGVELAIAEAVEWLHRVDETFSTYRPESVVSRLDRGEITLAGCPPEVAEVLRLCDEASRVSRGYFTSHPGGRLDPSAVVKGWAIERASRILTRAGAANHCVNGGGDVRLTGSAASGSPWRVGIAHPLRPGELAAVVTGRDLAVATSGTAERGAHIVDPHTGRPATALASITLIGESLTMTDAYATAAFAMGDAARDWVRELEGFEAFAVTASGSTWHTGDFPKLAILTD